MPWQMRLRDKPANYGFDSGIQPGDCWYEDWLVADEHGVPEAYRRSILSRQYLEKLDGVRPPLMIALPSEHEIGYRLICADQAYQRAEADNPTREGWTVTGDPPNITVSPSILATGDYHGFISGGVISEDVEGRRYPNIARTA